MTTETYAATELRPLGYHLVSESEKQSIWRFGQTRLFFECVCPAYPRIRALGCPLHHLPSDPGGSWPISDAKKIAIALQE